MERGTMMTLADWFQYLVPNDWETEALRWPPDAFAVCATALRHSGAYTFLARSWPPKATPEWERFIKDIGLKWRELCVPSGAAPPEVEAWWRSILANSDIELGTLNHGPKDADGELFVLQALLQICAAADEASAGIGLPGEADDFESEARRLFFTQIKAKQPISTLSKTISASKLCVLPKLHTPQTGVTMRSLSHNIAVYTTGEVLPQWQYVPHGLPELKDALNLLLVPWPTAIAPTHFSAREPKVGPLLNMPEKYGFFEYNIRGGASWPGPVFDQILEAGKELVGPIHGVILPELSIRADEVEAVWKQVAKIAPNAFLIAGAGDEPEPGQFGTNRVICVLPGIVPVRLSQDKHHRWLLTDSQVGQYGLFNRLNAGCDWWESIEIGERVLKFLPLTPWLVMCCLVCEDLARQDPIAGLIRAVGPNLVVALLMDGPQLANRWPARYATVLADDPGCSVLTLTSIGMARMSRRFGTPESRVVALWKDAQQGPFEIDLPSDAEAIVLSLRSHVKTEFTADGRSDEGASSYWILKGINPIRLREVRA